MLKQHRFLIPGIILLIILLSVGGGWWLSLPRGDELPASVVIEPSKVEESGIAPDASFAVTTGFTVAEEALREMLALDPAINYTLSGGGKEWTLTPVMPLLENTVYTFRVKNAQGTPVRSFAFQTRSDLLVGGTFPGDGELYVDINTGIEVRFNRPGVDLSKGFEILPAVSGRFETQEYSCRFIPDKPLEYNSIYRITLQNLRSSDGAELLEPYTFTFETAPKEGEEGWDDVTPDRQAVSFLPGDEMRVNLRGGERQAAADYTMTLHKFPGINAYMTALKDRDTFYRDQYGVKEAYEIATDTLDEIMNTEGKLMNSDGALSAPLPAGLSEGYYVFTLRGEAAGREQFAQQLIQVVNLSVYTQSVNGSTLFWLGDPVTGAPASATVQLEPEKGQKRAGETDEEGLATITTDDSAWAYATIVREGTPVWFARVQLSPPSEEEDLSGSYYAALYTDRSIYRPGDAIHFWGVVKPRSGGQIPETVRVGIGSLWAEEGLLSGMDVAVDALGTFTGVLEPDDLRADGYAVSVSSGEGVYVRSYVSVSEYVKPAYEITLETDKDLYYYGETVQFRVKAQYYDGTPAAGAKLLAECYEARLEDLPVTLDENGEASFTGRLDPSVNQRDDGRVTGWEPRSTGWSVRSADEQAVNLNEWASFMVLPSKIAAEITYEGDGKLSVEAAVLDDTKVYDNSKLDTAALSEFERLKGVPADIPVTLVVHKVTYHTIQTGSWYDYVNKQNVPVYETRREETVDRTIPLSTTAGKAAAEGLPVKEADEVSYWFELRFAGGVYGDVCATAYPTSPYLYPGEETYTFFPETGGQKIVPGQTVDLGIYQNGAPVEGEGRVLYTLVQDRVTDRGVFEDFASVEITEKHLPNVWVAGAYYDGRAMHAIEQANLSYDYSDRSLTVKVETDKEEYRPGDEMRATVSLTDAEGNPVGGRAALGVVDEAVFAVSEQRVELLEQLYRNIYYPSIVTSATEGGYDAGMLRYGATEEMAADSAKSAANSGGGRVRSAFADTADFVAVEVPGEGSVTVTVKLPDNVTSWRLTAVAVTEDLKAGDAVSNAVATLPFTLRPIVTDTYIEGDDLSVSALATGTALAGQEGDVSYTATLTGGKEASKTLEATAPAGSRCAFNFGKAETGTYTVRIEGRLGDNSDAVELPLTVSETGLLTPALATVDLAALPGVESARWPVQVTVCDEDAKPGFDALAWLSSQDGLRTEIIAAADRAKALYNNLQPAQEREPYTGDRRLEAIQGDDGGVIPLAGAGGDAALTAKMLMAAPELLQKKAAVAFLQETLKNPAATPADRVMAYVGLAAAKEPVLLDLQRLYETDGAEMEPYLRLYLGAALARMGDYGKAGEIYETVRTVRAGDALHIEDGDTRRATAAALLLATESGHGDANGLARYLMSGAGERGETVANLEVLAYARAAMKSAGEGKFTYETGGETKEVQLRDGYATLRLDANTVKNGKFRSQSGRLYAAVETLRPATGTAEGGFATVTKTYEPVGGSLAAGGQVKVTLKIKFNEDAPYGAYEISDYIPSGLRWLGGEQLVSPRETAIWPVLSQDGQRITGALYRMADTGDGGVMPLVRTAGATVRMLAGNVEAVISGVGGESEIAVETPEESAAESESPEASSAAAQEEPAENGEEPVSDEAEGDLPEENGGETEEAEEEPAAERRAPVEVPSYREPPREPEDPNTYVFTYYLSAALPGSFVTESAWVTYDGQSVKSDRGVIAVAQN